MEKRNYVISKSLPNLRDQYPKMEISQEQSLCNVNVNVNVTFRSVRTKRNLICQPIPTTRQTVVLYIRIFFLQKMWDGKPNETMFQNRLISNIVLIH